VIRRYTHRNGGLRLRLNPPYALTFHYPPYAVGPYAEDGYVAFAPWETLQPYLTPEGTKIFGGARPKGDDNGQP
jgi:hypothetical protein